MTDAPATAAFLSRIERFASVGSTNDVVRGWLAGGTPEVCVAVAREQTAGRGRHGRSWQAPPGTALLVSLGFRPTWLPADRAWRLPALVALAMCDAAEEEAGLRSGAIRLKWPNDLVVETSGPNAVLAGIGAAAEAAQLLASPLTVRKLAGVLGESAGLGTADARVIVGIGINADWPAPVFPAGLAGSMTSLREVSAGRPIQDEALLAGFLDHLETRVAALRAGYFDVAAWSERQATTGRLIELEMGGSGRGGRDRAADEGVPLVVRAMGVDAASGALAIEDPASPRGERLVHAGEVVHVRLAPEAV
jgi:BirA family biotin operon repressor/biotin-[acetyl-CoA-carboxylase] ligase